MRLYLKSGCAYAAESYKYARLFAGKSAVASRSPNLKPSSNFRRGSLCEPRTIQNTGMVAAGPCRDRSGAVQVADSAHQTTATAAGHGRAPSNQNSCRLQQRNVSPTPAPPPPCLAATSLAYVTHPDAAKPAKPSTPTALATPSHLESPLNENTPSPPPLMAT